MLYALPNGNEPNFGNLLTIDPATGNGFDLGPTGADMVALTTPEPSTLALLGVAALLGLARRR